MLQQYSLSDHGGCDDGDDDDVYDAYEKQVWAILNKFGPF